MTPLQHPEGVVERLADGFRGRGARQDRFVRVDGAVTGNPPFTPGVSGCACMGLCIRVFMFVLCILALVVTSLNALCSPLG